MTPPYARIAALIARAAHETTPEQEARTAALLACKLIKQHGLAVGTPLDELSAAAAAAAAARSSPSSEPKWQNWQNIRARFGSRCVECGEWISVGERCVWLKGTGIFHPTCWDPADWGQ